MPYKHIEDKRAHARNYYKQHSEVIKKQANDWYEANKDDPEAMKNRKDGARRWQRENRGRYLHQKMNYRLSSPLIQLVVDSKKSGCIKCPEDHPSCLQFHHRDPAQKDFTISAFTSKLTKAEHHLPDNLELLRREIAKCVVVCANCHWKLHAGVITLEVQETIAA